MVRKGSILSPVFLVTTVVERVTEVSRLSWLPCIFVFYFQVQSPLLLLILLISVTELLLVYAFKLFSVAGQPATRGLRCNVQVVSMAPCADFISSVWEQDSACTRAGG